MIFFNPFTCWLSKSQRSTSLQVHVGLCFLYSSSCLSCWLFTWCLMLIGKLNWPPLYGHVKMANSKNEQQKAPRLSSHLFACFRLFSTVFGLFSLVVALFGLFGERPRGNRNRGNRPERFWEGNLPLRGSLRGRLCRCFQRFLEVSGVFRGPLRVPFPSQSCGSCCP